MEIHLQPNMCYEKMDCHLSGVKDVVIPDQKSDVVLKNARVTTDDNGVATIHEWEEALMYDENGDLIPCVPIMDASATSIGFMKPLNNDDDKKVLYYVYFPEDDEYESITGKTN